MSGKYYAKVFEGPYSKMRQFVRDMDTHMTDQNKEVKKYY